jgi:FAD/FMN-containing dehydrogenase
MVFLCLFVLLSGLTGRAVASDGITALISRLVARGGRALNVTSPGYAGNATMWTPVTQTWPSVLLQPATVVDVVDCVLTLQHNRLPFRVRGSGHSYAGYSSHTGPVIDTRLLARVEVSFLSLSLFGTRSRRLDLSAAVSQHAG